MAIGRVHFSPDRNFSESRVEKFSEEKCFLKSFGNVLKYVLTKFTGVFTFVKRGAAYRIISQTPLQLKSKRIQWIFRLKKTQNFLKRIFIQLKVCVQFQGEGRDQRSL